MNFKHDVDEIMAVAKTCATRAEFRSKYNPQYQAARRMGILDEIDAFLPVSPNNQSPYSDDELIADAKRFNSREEWRNAGELERQDGNASHYGCALKRGREFMTQCCAHMPHGQVGNTNRMKYSDDDLLASARQFQTRGEWKTRANQHYQAARLRPIFDECVAHMRPAANPFAKDYIVYAYEFSDGYAYVGLTFVPENRKLTHLVRGPVFDHAQVCPNPVYKVLESGMTHDEVRVSEARWQAQYAENGWKALHSAKAGSLGTIHHPKWTREAILADARKYQTRKEWGIQ